MRKERVHDLTDEQTDSVLAKLATFATIDAVLKACTPRGNGKSIKTNKPDHGVFAYIWRMARFHSGADMTMPVVAFWDLGDGIEALTGIPLSIAIIRPNVKRVIEVCDSLADELVRRTGGNEFKATLRWGPLLGR